MISIVVISKDEPALDATLRHVCAQAVASTELVEVLVVDASEGRLDGVRRANSSVQWIDFTAPAGVRVSIPHQRNVGVTAASGNIIVFTDAGCNPREGWLDGLVAPLLAAEETVAAGLTTSTNGRPLYDAHRQRIADTPYLTECATINLAFRRAAFDAVAGFDENFEYGSDVDFTWRLVDAGHRIRLIPEAVVEHEFGTRRRQLKRSYAYGRARARLYRKHARRLPRILLDDPIAVVYPLFILGMPLVIRHRWYPALLLIPVWRNRAHNPMRVIIDHLAFGVGVLRELASQ